MCSLGACSTGRAKTTPPAGRRRSRDAVQFKMPTPETFSNVAHSAIARGESKVHTEGSVAPYLGI
jgi:hypothetical protein